MDALAGYAACEAHSRGRRYREAPPSYRGEYQRDRDRIIHAKAFRRLEYKTQVFVNHEGDLFRTRLTHSLEVAQLARSTARQLRLNEDLVEAIALAHDLGHAPFGHAGQDALNHCLRDHGGFEHNLQSLRIVDQLEQRYLEFDGLNLTFETREGILKHCPPSKAKQLGDVGARFLHGEYPSLEAQLANIADEIAYNNHDVDDGLRSQLLDIEALREQALFERHFRGVLDDWPQATGRRLIHETIRRMINAQVINLIETSQAQLDALQPPTVEAVRTAPEALITFSALMYEQHLELKRFLHTHLYRHYRVHRMSAKAHRIITRLFDAFVNDPQLLPPRYRDALDISQNQIGLDKARTRITADYIAGMTDRYAIDEYERMFNATVLP